MTDLLSAGKHFDLAAAGCFPTDARLLRGSRWLTESARTVVTNVRGDCDEITVWRLESLLRAGVTISDLTVDEIPRPAQHLLAGSALPSDSRLLSLQESGKVFQWLRLGALVPAGHVFEVSEELQRSVGEVCERLRLFGHTVPDEAALFADRLLASKNLDGKAPWRESTERLTVEEITSISERLAVDDVEIAGRLRNLGYDALPRLETLLTSRLRFMGGSWSLSGTFPLSAGARLGARHLLIAMRELGLGVAETVDRYRDLGFDVADAVGSLELMTLDAADGRPLWRLRGGRVQRGWVSRAADQLHMSVEEATRRLRSEGFVVLDVVPDAGLDAAVIGEIEQDRQPGRVIFSSQVAPVHRSSVIEFAARSCRPAASVAAGLRALGFEVPSMNDLGVVDDELQQICARFSRVLLWSFEEQPVSVGVVMQVAKRISRSVDYVAERLRSAGYEVADTTSLTDEDRFLLSEDLDNGASWLRGRDKISVWQLARAAIRLDRNPHLVARRLCELGYEVPEGWG